MTSRGRPWLGLVMVCGVLVGMCAPGWALDAGPADPEPTDATRCDLPDADGAMPDDEPVVGITRVRAVFVDRRRPTPAVVGQARRPCRVLPTEIRFPAAASSPLPLIVAAHGRDGDPERMGPLLDAWAAAGYVVVAPKFPVTTKNARGRPRASNNVAQAADLSFLIDRLLAPDPGSPAAVVAGLIDTSRIGATGMSLGGMTAYGLVANSCCRDTRVRAAVMLAAVHREFPHERYQRNRIPMFLIQGDADVGYHHSASTFPHLDAPKWFLTLHGSGHSPPFEVPAGPEAPLVRSATTAFWDRYLKDDEAAEARLASALRAVGVDASLVRDLDDRGAA